MREHETALFVEHLLELLPRVDPGNHRLAIGQRLAENILLDFGHQPFDALHEPFLRDGLLFERVPAHQFDRTVLHIARPHRQTHGDALQFVLRELEARAHVIAVIDLHADAFGFELLRNGPEAGTDFGQLVFALVDGHHHHLDRRQFRRQHEAVVVRMGHDERTHQSGRNAPRGRPHIFELALFVDILHVERLGEILSQKMRRTALQGLAVLHQRLDGQRILGARKPLVGRFVAYDDRNRHPLFGEFLVYVDHLFCLLDSLLARGMRRMALLPQELGGTQEQARTHLPAHDVRPLVAEDRKVAVRLDPVFIGVPDDGLRRGTHDQLLFELSIGVYHDALAFGIVLQAVVRHHGALLGKALDMVRLLREEGLGDEQREIGVLMPRILEHLVQRVVHLLPNGIAVGFDDHTSAYGRVFGQPGLHDQVVVPLRVVLVRLREVFEFLCHISLFFILYQPANIIKK